MRYSQYSQYLVAVLSLLILAMPVTAQTQEIRDAGQPPATQSAKPIQSRVTLVESAQNSRETAEELLRLQEDQARKSSASAEQLRQLYSEGLIARVELEKAQQDLTDANSKIEDTRRQIAASDQLIAEIRKAEELAKIKPALVKPTLMRTNMPGILRSNSTASWSIANLGAIEQFFSNKFRHALPTTAIGQSATHDRLAYDHRNAVDVGLHPDSLEGRALINYLQNAGIPFLAFRSAIPGVATGPHIHIGLPSHRIA